MDSIEYAEKIEYNKSGKILISPDEILLHLKETYNENAVYYQPDNLFIYFSIPGITISLIRIYIASYQEKNLKLYTISITLPCSLQDLKMFQAIINFIEDKCWRAGLHIQMNFDNHRNYPGRLAMTADTINNTWQQLMNPFCKLVNHEKPVTFNVSNGRLKFVLSSLDYRIGNSFKQFQDNFLPTVRKHIWQQQYSYVDTRKYYVWPERKNGLACKSFGLTLVAWNNSTPLLINQKDYLIFCINNKWVAIRPQKWEKILLPYFEQYDTINRNLLPIVPITLYEALKSKLFQYACSLEINCIIKKEQPGGHCKRPSTDFRSF
jgi:hypothetical protein